MLLILALLYFFQGTIHASTVTITTVLPRDAGGPADVTFPASAECVCPAQQRTIWDIIWSCLAILFACSWVSVHINMPEPNEKWWKIASRRVALVFWAIFAPEMIIFWAGRQWLAAREFAAKYSAHGWTKTHGYFIQMGGFTLFDGKESRGVLSEARMEELLRDGMIKFPTITEEEIRDRSKRDGLSKALVIGQTSWFITHCIARGAQGLIITELELATAAIATLNGVMYFLWWNKPFDVQCSVPVFLLDMPLTKEKSFQLGLPRDGGALRARIAELLRTVRDSLRITPKLTRAEVLKAVKFICLSPGTIILSMFSALLDMAGSDTLSDGALRVETFYAPTNDVSTSEGDKIVLFVSLTAVIFGAIHCAAWARDGFAFPSHAELLLWRICSAVTTGASLLAFITLFVSALGPRNKTARRSIGVFLRFATLAFPPIYIIARMLLLLEAVVSLRDLPPGALGVVTWVAFLPHI